MPNCQSGVILGINLSNQRHKPNLSNYMSLSSANITVTKVAALTGHRGSVFALYNLPGEDPFVLSGGGDGMVVRWNVANPADGMLRAQVGTNILALLRLPNSPYLCIGQLQGGIHVIDLERNVEVKHLLNHKKGVFALELTPDGSHFISLGGDGQLCLWRNHDFALVKSLPLADDSLRSAAYDLHDKTLAIGSSDNRVYLLNAADYRIENALDGATNSVFCVAWSPNGKYLLAGSRDAHIYVWEVGKKYQLYRRIPAHLFTVNSLAFSPDGQLFASGSRDKEIRIWDAHTFELLKVIDLKKFNGHVNSVNKLIWHAATNQLISAGDDRSLMIWDIQIDQTK